MQWKVGGRFKREGTYVYLWLIHVDAWQKPIQYCKAIILQLKINKIKSQKQRTKRSMNFVSFVNNRTQLPTLSEHPLYFRRCAELN